MKPFPQIPALPSLPPLPTLPSLKDLIDTSPQLFYPSSQITDRPRSRHGPEASSSRGRFPTPDHGIHQPHGSHAGSERVRGRPSDRTLSPAARSRSRSTTAVDSPRKRQSSFNFGEHRRGIGLLVGGSASATDLTGEWEPLAAPPAVAHTPLYRCDSLPSQHRRAGPAIPHGSPARPHSRHAPLPTASPAESPGRPSHRRAQSVAAMPPPLRKPPAPLGRLQEYSRNSLASTSAISLPTLIEDGAGPSSRRESPIIRPASRRMSRTSMISSIGSPTYPLSPERNIPHLLLPEDGDSETETDESSVPPPQREQSLRPPMSPRSRSVQDVPRMRHSYSQSIASLPSSRRTSVTFPSPLASPRLAFSPSLASVSLATTAATSVSDVAVLATWSFPPSPPKTAPEDARQRVVSGSSERLKERLRTLSLLDTTVSTSETSTPTDTTPAAPAPNRMLPPANLHRASTTINPHTRRPRMASHRHSMSSPSACLPIAKEGEASIFPSPDSTLARPQRPPLHGRYRPMHTSSLSIMAPPPLPSAFAPRGKLSRTLSSSPGSMTSSSSACPSPTGSVASLPPLAYSRALVRTRTMESDLPSRRSLESPSTPEAGGGWWKWGRRNSMDVGAVLQENMGSTNTTPKAKSRAAAGKGIIVSVKAAEADSPIAGAKIRQVGAEEGDRSLEEEFIDFEDM